ncbi:hypothetical protein UFOVP45_102 [uncultured Caudovirales phage]|uniref:Uncharacterized protein n=1 Tax=uncultured Caudovirales phage TaxID=2100421 RepID=A0A6J5KQ57_9CAUD|nr:hypothetical protein UFOVP45_102 [uncultured Caudovirales phage]
MAGRMREVVGAHSTWYVCDEHGWDFTNEDGDTCPVCKGEALAEARIIKLLDSDEAWQAIDADSVSQKHETVNGLIALIKGENK